uniref:Uncharacterized protein n=1 Tax=Ixodes ricinus TaxID=34613 RepID=A0A6B0URH5_IXORI
MCPSKVFFLFSLKRFSAEKIMILLSMDWHASHLPLGARVTAGMECMEGSAMYFMSTGMSHSQTRMLLSSEVETKRRLSSTKVIVFTAPRWRSYSCTISLLLMSQQTIFLSEVPATNRFCLSLSGLNLTQ